MGSRYYCSSCGRETDRNVRLCPFCGGRSEGNAGYCSRCGAGILIGSSNCTACGTEIAPARRLTTNFDGEAVDSTEYMGFWVRLAAFAVDWVILLIIQAVIFNIFSISGTSGTVLGLLTGALYNVLFIALRGQTPGKTALGIQVINNQGEVPGFSRVLRREIVGKFLSALALLLGFFWVGWDTRKRGWHDHMGGTYVIRKSRGR